MAAVYFIQPILLSCNFGQLCSGISFRHISPCGTCGLSSPRPVCRGNTRSAASHAAKTSLHTANNGSCSHSRYIRMLDSHRKSTIIWRSSAHIFLKSLLHLTDSNASLLSGGIYAKKIIFEKGSFCKNIGYLSWHCRIRYDIRVLLCLSQRSAV